MEQGQSKKPLLCMENSFVKVPKIGIRASLDGFFLFILTNAEDEEEEQVELESTSTNCLKFSIRMLQAGLYFLSYPEQLVADH